MSSAAQIARFFIHGVEIDDFAENIYFALESLCRTYFIPANEAQEIKYQC